MLVPRGSGSDLANPPRGSTSSDGYDPSAVEVTGDQRGTLRSQLQGLGPRAGARPVIIALHPAGTDEFTRQGAWLGRPVREDGRFRVSHEASSGQQAGWR